MLNWIKRILGIKPKARLIYPDYGYYEKPIKTKRRPTKREADRRRVGEKSDS